LAKRAWLSYDWATMPAEPRSLVSPFVGWLLGALVLVSAVAPSACAARSTAGDATSKAVQEELARLKAEQASLQSRVDTLEAAAKAPPRASLPVVKLVPEPSAAAPSSEVSSATALNTPLATEPGEDEERLVITGSGDNLKTTSSKAKGRDPAPARR
jgi:hypothetical protein